MSNKLTLNIGFGNSVVRGDITAVVQPNSAPIKRFVKQKQEDGGVIDATMGKKLRAVIVLKSGYVVLSAISVTSLISRIEDES
ncbi:MAG: DUF370 domain-containing protein [Candidatus Aminicenantes bacterium]|nr:MAG: DUF370 domain-containing protein [Candidatus Aminicenantes bacterium]